MPARWSLRSTLVALVALTLLPILGLAAWQAEREQAAKAALRGASLSAAADLVGARYSELIEASRRLLSTACMAHAVRRSANIQPEPVDVSRCEAYFTRVLSTAPSQYSVLLVTDDQGIARCASQPTAVGMSFADRDIFQQVRSAGQFATGEQVASRLGPNTIIPVALPIASDGAFRGMCAVGITLKALGDIAAAPSTGSIGAAVVARDGATIGGDPAAMRRLPISSRLAASIAGGQLDFSEYGRDSSLYQFRVQPITGSNLFAVTSVPIPDGIAALTEGWAAFGLFVLALIVVLLVVWSSADRWCVQPLRYIQTFAENQGFSIVREFCGHGIGQKFHEEPQVLHYGRPGTLEELVPGMIFTIEPMINAGRREIREMGDGWTIVTKDRSLSAQWEHTVLVTETGYEVLTLSAGSPPIPAFVTAAQTTP